MKRSMVLLCILLIIGVVSFVDAQNPNCSDSDGGKNYYIKGINQGLNSYFGPQIDFCFNYDDLGEVPYENLNKSSGTGVIEHYCDSHNNVANEGFKCPNGCLDGACIGEQPECSETDNGVELYAKGSVTGAWVGDINGPISVYEDVCSEFDNKLLQEFTCELVEGTTDTYGIVQTGFDCPRGCRDGACIPISCNDSDGGKYYYIKGFVRVIAEEIDDIDSDTCINKNLLSEQYCSKGQQKIVFYNCAGGCSDGACNQIELTPEEGVPLEIPKDEIIEKDENTSEKIIEETQGKSICNGCELDNKCYPFGFRKEGEYCSESDDFVSQVEPESTCENNFECSTNLCIDSRCLSSSLWQKILDLLRKLFG